MHSLEPDRRNLVVLGGRPARLVDLDIRRLGVSVAGNGVVEETGVASAVMGNPISAVAWLDDKVSAFGITFEPGHVMLSGSFTSVVRFGPAMSSCPPSIGSAKSS